MLFAPPADPSTMIRIEIIDNDTNTACQEEEVPSKASASSCVETVPIQACVN
jgi:hypothetical protein